MLSLVSPFGKGGGEVKPGWDGLANNERKVGQNDNK